MNVLQENTLDREGSYILRGDNLSGLQLLQAPSGPWRTRHLRLRSHVLRERLKHHLWSVEHVPGTELCADLVTKSITQSQSWEAFRRTVGLRAAAAYLPDGEDTPNVKKVACAAMASLGLLAAVPGLGGAVKLASLLGLVAAATVALNVYKTATGQSNKRSNATHVKKVSRWSRENEPGPGRNEEMESRWLRENEPNPCRMNQDSHVVRSNTVDSWHTGTPGDEATPTPWQPAPRLCAVKAPILHRGLGTDTPWVLGRFATPPTGADRWECLGSGDGAGEWWVRVLKKSRVRAFHPLHRGTPFQISRMSTTRMTVTFHRSSSRELWQRKVVTDDWTNSRNCDIDGIYERVGYTFFYVRFVGAMEGVLVDPDSGLAPGPQPPRGTIAQGERGYGNTPATQSRALERGRSVGLQLTEPTSGNSPMTYDGMAISARASSDGVPGSGYAERLRSRQDRGEVHLDEAETAWLHSLHSEGLIPPEADGWPEWMGISTPVDQRPATPVVKLEEDSQSDGSFEKLG